MNNIRFAFLFFILLVFPFFSLLAQSDDVDQDADETVVEDTGGVYPTELQAEESDDEVDRSKFGEFQQLPAPTYQKDLHISSQRQNESRPGYYILDGYVDIGYKSLRLQADHAEFDINTKDLVATGNVVLDQEGQRITGDRLELNMESKIGTMYNAYGYVPPQVFFWGKKLDKLGDEEYKLYDGIFTECSQLQPHWKLATTSARMTINEYIHFKNFTLKAKSLPIFYSPYMMWPIKRERATGFLFPKFGPNSNKGFYVGNSFFWAMSRSTDSTYWVDHWAQRGWGGGGEFRYASAKEQGGSVKSYYANDSKFGKQWSVDAQVKQDLPADFRLASVVDVFSSYDYEQDVTNSFARNSIRSQRAQAFVTRNWSYYSLNFLGDYTNTQFGSNVTREVSLFHKPEVEFRSRSQKLGATPLFWTFLGSFNALGRGDQAGDLDTSFSLFRYDSFPSISLPITTLSWFTLTPAFGYRMTYYTKQLDRNVPGQPVTDQSLIRNYADFALDLRGPNFNKIFDTPGMGYSKKWKHAIEPQVTFRYIQDIEELRDIIRLDEVDDVQGSRFVTYGITNLLYSKRPVKDEREYESDEYQYYNPKPLEPPVDSAWEFISWRIQQSYSFQSDSFDVESNPNLKPFSPISSVLRVNPTVNHSIDFRYDYDVNFKQTSNVQISSSLRNPEAWYANLSYVYSKRGGRPEASPHQIRANALYGFWQNRLVLSGELDYDIETRDVLRNAMGVIYNDDCFTIGMEWRRFETGSGRNLRVENQITFTVSLPNIGSLVNYRSGQPPRRF